jgi:pyruvate dehydrogenase complex dehydrogenase (E1) component
MPDKDIDPQETVEWLDAFRSVSRFEGKDRSKYILQKLIDMAHEDGMDLPDGVNTAYLNTIHVDKESELVVKHEIEHRNQVNHSLECHDYGCQGKSNFFRVGRTYSLFRIMRNAL